MKIEIVYSKGPPAFIVVTHQLVNQFGKDEYMYMPHYLICVCNMRMGYSSSANTPAIDAKTHIT